MNSYHVIGLMSGTSVDGIDLALCRFDQDGGAWRYSILQAVTVDYSMEWKTTLNGLFHATASDYAQTHTAYGRFLGEQVKKFMDASGIVQADCVASHGHTIFHRPGAGYTSQIGEGAALSAACGIPVVCDFRTSDVAYGGQGAPLVPLGDRLLFSEYSHCLNLGGIANISFEENDIRLALDVCPCNMLLDRYAAKAGQPYDKNGDLAASGKIVEPLLQSLESAGYYQLSRPKSLGREDMENVFIPLVEKHGAGVPDTLRTLVEHIALQVAAETTGAASGSRLLVSGGGAWNAFLVDRIRARVNFEVVVPDARTVNYKEALIFAFLGLLRLRGEPNCLHTVTGAAKDVTGGAIYLP